MHFLQESVGFHFQDLGRQCIILAGFLEDLGRKCLDLQESCKKRLNLQETSDLPESDRFVRNVKFL